jgi:hypothetical protein
MWAWDPMIFLNALPEATETLQLKNNGILNCNHQYFAIISLWPTNFPRSISSLAFLGEVEAFHRGPSTKSSFCRLKRDPVRQEAAHR